MFSGFFIQGGRKLPLNFRPTWRGFACQCAYFTKDFRFMWSGRKLTAYFRPTREAVESMQSNFRPLQRICCFHRKFDFSVFVWSLFKAVESSPWTFDRTETQVSEYDRYQSKVVAQLSTGLSVFAWFSPTASFCLWAINTHSFGIFGQHFFWEVLSWKFLSKNQVFLKFVFEISFSYFLSHTL